MAPRRCPCGTGLPYDGCCGPLHAGTAPAATAEQLMRSRYSAFAVGDPAYLLATWHPTTRPPSLELDPGVRWLGLDVLSTDGGGLLAAEGTVEFRAHWDGRRTARCAARGQPVRPGRRRLAVRGRRLRVSAAAVRGTAGS